MDVLFKAHTPEVLNDSLDYFLIHQPRKGNKEGSGKEKRNAERATFSWASQGGRLVWTGRTDTTVTTLTKQDATELPPFILFILSYYLHIYSLILQ